MTTLSAPASRISSLWNATINLILPPRCAGTGEVVDAPGMLAPAFWAGLSFIDKPFCSTCGLPFGFEAPYGTVCAACMETEPLFDRARAAVVYNDASRSLILGFKHGDRLHTALTFTPWLLRAGADMVTEADIVLPVPLHRKRLFARRYNQSALLAKSVAARAGLRCLPDGLIRLRHTLQQKGLSRKERHDNVKNAFAVNGRYMQEIKGKNVLLVDDVYTSGATLNECARTLRKHGAERVFVLTVARVTREEFQS